jgi:hypothetical protein
MTNNQSNRIEFYQNVVGVDAMPYFVLMSLGGATMAAGAYYLGRNVARSEPQLMRIEPRIGMVVLFAAVMGMIAFGAGIIGTIWAAMST